MMSARTQVDGGGDSVAVRFFLVDDHETFRIGLRTVIEANADHRVVAEAASVREASRRLDEVECDVLVVDLSMPGATGLALIRELLVASAPSASWS